jgi:hypothetical protein
MESKLNFNMDEYVSEAVVAKIINKSVHTLRADRHYRRGIPVTKAGGSCRYLVRDVYAYMADNTVRPEPTSPRRDKKMDEVEA